MVPHNSDDDEIAKLLEIASTPKKKITKTNPEIDDFIFENNILAGKKKIPSYIVYYRYFLCKKTRERIPRLKFLHYFGTKFTKTKTDDGMGYLLNPKGFDLTPQGFFRARAFLRKEKYDKTKTK